ncbi:MAG: hypothetical protein H6Q78_1164 [Candidatus Krumholzibacteriota bacterium]|nr:hypothetical protein [Candidatus Krumholzibacteriota bacterium]
MPPGKIRVYTPDFLEYSPRYRFFADSSPTPLDQLSLLTTAI